VEFLRKAGVATLNTLAYLGSLATLAFRSAWAVLSGPFLNKPVSYSTTIEQAMEAGVRALPILSLITFFIGLILALQAAYELRSFGAMNLVASGVAISMSRELGPLITAVIVIGRSGSAFAAELGTMKVSEEIDALETIWALAMGILGGAVFGVLKADFTWYTYIKASLDALEMRDVTTGLIKSVMFGITITAVGCLEGLLTDGGAEQVGRSTTRAVVVSIFLVILVDLIFTTLFFVLGGH
jgi:phospholipid/cholesterol/gamma-HCH transport system permease protein